MNGIEPVNCLQTVYVQEGNKIHKIVLYEKREPDTFEISKPKQKANEDKGILSSFILSIKKPILKVLGRKNKTPEETRVIASKPNKEPSYSIKVATFDAPQNENFVFNNNYQIIPDFTTFVNENRKSNAPISITQSIKLPNEDNDIMQEDYSSTESIPNNEAVEETIEEGIPIATQRELSKREIERLNAAAEIVEPDKDSLKTVIIDNGVENYISQSKNKITLSTKNESVSMEFKKNQNDEKVIEIGVLSYDKKEGGIFLLDEEKKCIIGGSFVRVPNWQNISSLLNKSIELNKQAFETGFDYEKAQNIIQNIK